MHAGCKWGMQMIDVSSLKLVSSGVHHRNKLNTTLHDSSVLISILYFTFTNRSSTVRSLRIRQKVPTHHLTSGNGSPSTSTTNLAFCPAGIVRLSGLLRKDGNRVSANQPGNTMWLTLMKWACTVYETMLAMGLSTLHAFDLNIIWCLCMNLLMLARAYANHLLMHMQMISWWCICK